MAKTMWSKQEENMEWYYGKLSRLNELEEMTKQIKFKVEIVRRIKF